jgi:2-polyprenyl-3-methyl-5-hydroxy-6-metoxy-1,4-benzoquinol methylase
MQIDYTQLHEVPCPVCAERAYSAVTTRFDGGRLVRCTGCKHVYLNPSLSDTQLDAIYGAYHITSDDATTMGRIEAWFADPAGPYQRALALVDSRGGLSGKRVLEIGSGPGRFLHACREGGAAVTGIDISPQSLRLAKQFYGLELLPLALEDAVAQGALAGGQFDLIFAFELIEHVRHPGALTAQIHELLAPGGLLVLSTPNFGLFELMRDSAPPVRTWQEHLHFFEVATLADLLGRHHFEVLELGTLAPVPPEERSRQQLAASPQVMAIWQRVRGIGAVRRVKAWAFGLLGRRHDSAEVAALAGMTLFCVARRPA